MEYILSSLVSHRRHHHLPKANVYGLEIMTKCQDSLGAGGRVTGGCAVAGYWCELELGRGRVKVLERGLVVVEPGLWGLDGIQMSSSFNVVN